MPNLSVTISRVIWCHTTTESRAGYVSSLIIALGVSWEVNASRWDQPETTSVALCRGLPADVTHFLDNLSVSAALSIGIYCDP